MSEYERLKAWKDATLLKQRSTVEKERDALQAQVAALTAERKTWEMRVHEAAQMVDRLEAEIDADDRRSLDLFDA